MVNNFELMTNHLHFNSEDDFYFLQILQRPKDGNNVRGNNKNRLDKYYIIKSIEQFKNYEREIIDVCKMFNARAYIHPTKRSFKEVAKVHMRNVFENYASENYINSGREYSTACGQSYVTSDKKYIIDLDTKDYEVYLDIKLEVLDYCEPINEDKVLYHVPTLQGYHIICKPFNVKKFNDAYPNIDVHKNNPTLLYYCKGG